MEINRQLMSDSQPNNPIPTQEEMKVREMLDDLLKNYTQNKIQVPDRGNMELTCGEKCCMIFLNLLVLICIFPILSGFYTVQPLQAVVLMFMGKVVKVQKQPGLSWYWPVGRISKTVSLGINTLELKGSSVPDKNGSPMNVSAIVTYKITDPVASLFNVDDFNKFIYDQGLEVVKRVLCRFAYRSTFPDEPSLLDDTMIIGENTIIHFLSSILQQGCII